jgi:hypothetical protein
MEVGQSSPTLAATNGLAALELTDADLFTPQKPERPSLATSTPQSACATVQPRSGPTSRLCRVDSMRPCSFDPAKGSSLLSSDFLPEDCLLQILRSLAHNDLARLAVVNREFLDISCQDALWEPLCRKEYNVNAEDVRKYWPLSQLSWKEVYLKLSESAIKLEFSRGPRADDIQILRRSQDEFTIGRSRRNHVCLLLDDAVSRKHARIRYHNRSFWIQDVGSSNGTWMRNQCLPHYVDVRLHPGDVVEVGVSCFSVKLHFDEAPNTSATDESGEEEPK